MIRRIFIVLLALGLMALLGYSIYYIKTQPSRTRLEGIDIVMLEEEGVQPFMKAEDVGRELQSKGLNYEGMLLDSIDVGVVERRLRENPLFRDVEVYISSVSKRMKVEVKQKEALLLVHRDEGSYYVSKERGLIPANTGYSVCVPIATGQITEEMACQQLYDLVSVIKSDPYLRHYFGQIHVDEEEGVILCPRLGHSPVMLGRGQDYKEMLHKYKVFAQSVLPRVGFDAYEYIKLGYRQQIVVRPRHWREVSPEIEAKG